MAHRSNSPFNPTRLLSAAVIAAVLGTAALSVWAQPGGHGGHGGPGMQGGGMMGMPLHGRMAERMLDSVNASAEQRAQVKQITERAAAEMKAQHEAGKGLREQALKLFTQPVVDANAAEALRQQMLQRHDQASRRMMQTMLEISRVLTPEQRKQLADRMAQRGDMARRHQHERQQLEGQPAQR
jgi:periplasmic protein CpxP/Spy